MFPSKLSVYYLLKNRVKPFAFGKWNSTSCGAEHPPPIVTIVDVISTVGRYLALLLKQSPNIAELRLHDRGSGVSVLGEDLSHIDTRVKIVSYAGTNTLRKAVENASIVVSIGGCKRVPGETPQSLFEKNINSVRMTALNLTEFNPKAIFCIARPPIEALVPLVSEEYKKAGVYDWRKIIGISTVASMQANYFVAKSINKNPSTILCPIVGGLSEKTTVAVLSQIRPKIHLDPINFNKLQDSIAYAEDDTLNLQVDGDPVCLAPALAASRFVNVLLRALKGEGKCVECAFVHQPGHIGKFLSYMNSIVKLGKNGVESCHMPRLTRDEAARLKKAASYIRQNIAMGESYGNSNCYYRDDLVKDSCLGMQNQCKIFPKEIIKTENQEKLEKLENFEKLQKQEIVKLKKQ